jgi:hypothetical protein
MESNADRESYWLLAEAATWIQTRDIDQVLGIEDPSTPLVIDVESKQALEGLHKRCRSGGVRSVGRRCTYYDSLQKRSQPIPKPLLWKSRGEGAPSDVTETIPPNEWADLEWEPPVDGKVIGSLRSRSLRRRAWMMVQFSRSDVMREWPAPNVSESDSLKLAPDKSSDRRFRKFMMPRKLPVRKRRTSRSCRL